MVRVAAVVSDGAPPDGELDGLWPLRSAEYSDVDATLCRYAPLIEDAARAGATLIVLPEVAVRVNASSRSKWLEGVGRWASTHRTTVVAPFFDESRPANELAIVGPDGASGATYYEKQHPAPVEVERHARMSPGTGRFGSPSTAMSTVICVDLDYGDLVRPVTQVGGVLAVPANDWPELADLHHRTAVWAPVMSGVPMIRATGHGISAAYDASGKVICQQSSLNGPVVLVADLPVQSDGIPTRAAD